ncbi:MAG: universal stress protein [Bacteroidales bacterium]|nr:universal stress protein [Bacteroidales bacterium]
METRENIILVPVDFTEQSNYAIEFSYNIAQMSNASIYLCHVVTENNPLWGLFGKKEQNNLVEKLKEKLSDYANLLVKKTGLKIYSYVTHGPLVESIIETAEKLKVKFLIMGTHVKSSLKTKLIGSNALRIINEASFPVITLKQKPVNNVIKNIILPLDLTKETKQKVSYAIHFGRYFNAVVHVCTVNTSNDTYIMGRLKLQLEQVYNFISAQNIECTQTFLTSEGGNDNVYKALYNFSHERNADLIMIMTQQETNFTRLVIGSLAQEIINNFDIPVMSIAPK